MTAIPIPLSIPVKSISTGRNHNKTVYFYSLVFSICIVQIYDTQDSVTQCCALPIIPTTVIVIIACYMRSKQGEGEDVLSPNCWGSLVTPNGCWNVISIEFMTCLK